LGLALFEQGRIDEAIDSYDKAFTHSPSDPGLLCAKGVALKSKGYLDRTIEHYLHAINLQPDVPELHHNLALTYQSVGNFVEAEKYFERTLELQPSNEMARHLLAGLRNITTDRAPASYVRDTFDSYADNFDTHLVGHLKYHTPEMLAGLILDKLSLEYQTLNILDLGCGTGLFGEHVKKIKKKLIGIDLSSKMIDKAIRRGIYDELIVGDLLDHMATVATNEFQLIVATDVFNYVGNLLTVFQQASRLLAVGSWFGFSLEAASNDAEDFVLGKTGRYQHGRNYVPRLCKQFGFDELGFAQSTLRMDGDTPVTGYLYLLMKTDPLDHAVFGK
jgi:predicted TPR repeat methyltransferase